MGTPWDPDDPPYEFSENDCPTCTPDLWPEGETAKYVVATFNGIDKCAHASCVAAPEPPNGIPFILEQDPVAFCVWEGHTDEWLVMWNAAFTGGTKSLLGLYSIPGNYEMFLAIENSPCETSFGQGAGCIAPHCGENGTGAIT